MRLLLAFSCKARRITAGVVTVLAVGIFVALVGTARPPAAASPATTTTPPSSRLLVVGDSVLAGVPAAGALGQLEAALPGWQVTFDAKECRSIQGPRKACGNEPGTVTGGLEEVKAHGSDFDAVVLQLGTNDAADPASAQPTIASAKAILDQLKTVPHVYWMTIREAGHYASGYAELNRLLRELPQAYPNLTIIDWAAATKDRPELFGPDGLHLNDAGAAYATTVIAGAVTGHLDQAVPTITPPSTSVSSVSPSAAPASSATAAPATSTLDRAASSRDTTNIIIGVLVALALVAGIVIAVLAGRRRERKHHREDRTARVEAELARSAAALREREDASALGAPVDAGSPVDDDEEPVAAEPTDEVKLPEEPAPDA